MILTCLSGVIIGHAARKNSPNSLVLNQTFNFYRTHKHSLAKKYHLEYSAQTSMSNHGISKIYVDSSIPDIHKSVKLAIRYWNSKIGRTIFKIGSKKSHTITVNLSKAKTTANDHSDAWWIPAKHMIQIRLSTFSTAKSALRNAIMNYSEISIINRANRNIDNYAKTVADKTNAATLNNTYRKKEIIKVKQRLTDELKYINHHYLDRKARVFEYANTIAHELGHSLGLKHSTNKKDLMYWKSGSPKIYNYNYIKKSTMGFNIINSTDEKRANLAIKIHQAISS